MGGLIQTKGTKLLAAHLNQEFSTYIDFYRKPANMLYFNTGAAGYDPLGTGGLLYATNNLFDVAPHSLRTDIVGPPSQGKCLLPYFPTGTRHPHLENRWLWFLNTSGPNNLLGSLTAANDQAIAAAIYAALFAPNGAPPYTYKSITFEAVETVLPQQQVAAKQAHDDGTLYMQILLMTQQAIPPAGDAATGLPALDPQ
jgi:hypothetical protein